MPLNFVIFSKGPQPFPNFDSIKGGEKEREQTCGYDFLAWRPLVWEGGLCACSAHHTIYNGKTSMGQRMKLRALIFHVSTLGNGVVLQSPFA